jgi:hypothetical protein
VSAASEVWAASGELVDSAAMEVLAASAASAASVVRR